MANSANPKKAVLVIEDNADIRETLKDALEFDGYPVITAENGRDGLAKLRSVTPPGLIILDLSMPVMGGREFLDVVRADPRLATIPVVILSAHADTESTLGAVAFMSKPPELDRLMAMVERYIVKG